MRYIKRDFFYKRISTNNIIAVVRILVAAFFIFSGGAKFWSFSSFSDTLSGYGFLPQILLPLFTYGIPAFEIAGGLLLLIGWRVSQVSLSLLIMILIFTIAAFIKYQNGQIADCGCFGELLERKNNWVLFFENTFLMILLAILQFKN